MIEILIGIMSGIVSGMGLGGGTILIILLTLILKMEQHNAQASNLIFFIPTAIVTIIVNIRNKNIDLKTGIIISIFGIIGALIGATISLKINVNILKKCFGIFLLLISINEIYTIIKMYKKV